MREESYKKARRCIVPSLCFAGAVVFGLGDLTSFLGAGIGEGAGLC